MYNQYPYIIYMIGSEKTHHFATVECFQNCTNSQVQKSITQLYLGLFYYFKFIRKPVKSTITCCTEHNNECLSQVVCFLRNYHTYIDSPYHFFLVLPGTPLLHEDPGITIIIQPPPTPIHSVNEETGHGVCCFRRVRLLHGD